MKKTIRTILALCCLALVVAACSKDDDPVVDSVLTLSLKNLTIADFEQPSSRANSVDVNGYAGLVKKQFVAGDVLRIQYYLDNEDQELYAKCGGADQWSFYTDAACTTAAQAEFDPENLPAMIDVFYEPADDAEAGFYRDWLSRTTLEENDITIGADGTLAPQFTLIHRRTLLSVASAKQADGETDLEITALSAAIGYKNETEAEHTSTFVKTEAGWQAIALHNMNNTFLNYIQSFSLTLADGNTYTISDVNKSFLYNNHYALHIVLDAGKLSIEIEEATEIPAWTDGGSSVYVNDYDRQIATYADLVALRDEINSATNPEAMALKAIQTADIVMPTDAEAWTMGIGATPEVYFGGVYNGNGYTISGLRIKTTNFNAGLFGWAENATLVKIHLREVDIECTGFPYNGSLVGSSRNSTISRCTATGVVKGNIAGGLVGQSYETSYTRNHSACTVGESGISGGLVGYSILDNIISCVATGNVTATPSDFVSASAGGLVGESKNTTIWHCYATGNVTAINTGGSAYAGGLVGLFNGGSIQFCYSTGLATASSEQAYAGTFIGSIQQSSGSFTSCWAPKPEANGRVIGNFVGFTGGISADGSLKPVEVVNGTNAGIYPAKTLVSDDTADATGPSGAKVASKEFISYEVWTKDDYPKIVFDPF